MAEYQRCNVYNSHLVFGEDIAKYADLYLDQMMKKLRRVYGMNPLDSVIISNSIDDLNKYMILYGMRISKQDHVRLIQWHLQLIHTPNLDLYCIEKLCKVVSTLLKKKYLLSRKDLVIEWRPLYELHLKWESSSLAVRGLLRVYDEAKLQLKGLIKAARPFFRDEDTQEMLDEWRPLLCSTDGSMLKGFKNFNLFLPTTSRVKPELSYQLWFEEFWNLWKTFGNGPAWEVELFSLWSRLALQNVGRIDWSPCVETFFTRFMIALGIPVTYASSQYKISYGLSNNATSLTASTRWIVYAMNGNGKAAEDPVQKRLDKMLGAIESYFHPANINIASEGLHLFISLLCTFFVRRVHLERYNKKWNLKTPPEHRLTDEDITHFVKSLLPITFQILYSGFEEDRRNVFNLLATLKPDLVLPTLLKKMHADVQLMNTPNRFTACVATLSACSRTLVEHYPLEVMDVLGHLLPGINVNDIYKSTDIFLLMSDFLDMIWMIDFSNPESRPGKLTETETQLCIKSSMFEDFVLNFVDRCFTLVENSSREQTRQENDTMDESLNEEEIAADCTISDTFQKMMTRISHFTFNVTFDKLKRYVDSRILEPTVAGAIVAAMCKACTNVEPERTLKFFVPHLCQRIETILEERVNHKKSDHELQYVLKLLVDIISVRGVVLSAKTDENPVLPYINEICDRVLDKALNLPQRDEYELAQLILSNLLHNLTHIRPITRFPAQDPNVKWSRAEHQWARETELNEIKCEWYVPSASEC